MNLSNRFIIKELFLNSFSPYVYKKTNLRPGGAQVRFQCLSGQGYTQKHEAPADT